VASVSVTAIAPKTEHVLAGDNVTATLRYADGSVATLLYTALGASDFGKEYMEVYFDGKVLVLDDYKSLQVHGARVKGWSASVQDKGHLQELQEFASYAVSLSLPTVSIRDLYFTTNIAIACSEQSNVNQCSSVICNVDNLFD